MFYVAGTQGRFQMHIAYLVITILFAAMVVFSGFGVVAAAALATRILTYKPESLR
jgi:hypothetical protein